jgi:hypothetical protein
MKATPHEQREAQFVAQLMRTYDDLWQRVARATGSESDWEDFCEQMKTRASIIELHVNFFGNRARFLRLVAEVLNGKTLRGAPHDDLVLQAIKKANKRRRKTRKAGRGMDVRDLLPRPFPEIDEAYVALTKTKPNDRLDERQLRRRVEALGYKRKRRT